MPQAWLLWRSAALSANLQRPASRQPQESPAYAAPSCASRESPPSQVDVANSLSKYKQHQSDHSKQDELDQDPPAYLVITGSGRPSEAAKGGFGPTQPLSGHGPVKTFSIFTDVTFRPSSSLICALQSCLVTPLFSPCFRA
jgi:hypothetical protein